MKHRVIVTLNPVLRIQIPSDTKLFTVHDPDPDSVCYDLASRILIRNYTLRLELLAKKCNEKKNKFGL